MSRLETLREWVQKDPNDVFSLYGLAMEYVKAADTENALKIFGDLKARFPDYLATYYHMGKALASSDRAEEAKQTYQAGIEAARRKGDGHTLAELEEALDELVL